MFRKVLSFGGLLLLAGTAVLVTPGSVQAQHRGGGFHGGGFHHGGFHHGGFHHGIHRGMFDPRFNRGFNRFDRFEDRFERRFNRGFFDRRFSPGFRRFDRFEDRFERRFHRGFFDPRFTRFGFHRPWGFGGGFFPGFGLGLGGGYGGGSYSSPYYGDSGYYDYRPAPPAYDDLLAPTSAPAHINVNLPANAELWVNGQKVDSTGATRDVTTPALSSWARYTYEIQARWNDNGQEVTQTQQVEVTAGTRVSVKFPLQPTKAPTAPSH